MKFAFGFFLLFSLYACSSSEKELEGVWLFVNEMEVLGKDSFQRRRPILLDFRKEGQMLRHSFANQQGLNAQTDSMKWQVDGDFLVVTSDQADSFRILYQTKDSLALGIVQSGYFFSQSYRKLSPNGDAKQAETLKKQLLDQGAYALKLQGEKLDSNQSWPILQFFRERYLILNRPQFSPFIWSVVSYQNYNFLMLDALSGQPLSWDLVEVQNQGQGKLSGNYYQNGKLKQLELEALPAPNSAGFPNFLDRTWSVQVLHDSLLNLPPNAKIEAGKDLEQLHLQADGRYWQTLLDSKYQGFWEAGYQPGFFLLYDEKGQSYRYLNLEAQAGTPLDQEVSAVFLPLQARGRQLPVRLFAR